MVRQTKLRFSRLPPKSDPENDDKAAETPVGSSRDPAQAPTASVATFTPPPSQPNPPPPGATEPTMDPSLDLPDSTDWLGTSLSAFEPLEAALRCEICKEFYDTPVITSCSHTFCSRCIRRCITVDGKCPTCKKQVQADKLVPNYVVREIVERFQLARPRAMELAKQDSVVAPAKETARKRKIDDTDIEEENIRQTRSRQTRSRTERGEEGGADSTPIEIADSEDEGDDEEFLPKGMVRCPICSKPMKEEQVFPHLNDCPGDQKDAGGRSTRSRAKNEPSNSFLRRPQRQPSLVQTPTRLPQPNYALLNDKALKKKLGDLGLPIGGTRPQQISRYTEWLNICNSNCDSVSPKSKRDLLRELDTWEKTQGSNAPTTTKVMRDDFDGIGHAKAHENQFADLIAEAKRKRGLGKKPDDSKDEETKSQDNGSEAQTDQPEPQPQPPSMISNPYDGNEIALASIREKVERANRGETVLPSPSQGTSSTSNTGSSLGDEATGTGSQPPIGITNHFASPTRKLPMFTLPEDPIVDVDTSEVVQ